MLETENQAVVFYTENQLKDLVKEAEDSLKFVFLASCHSEAFGKIFRNVGISHVICIDEKLEMLDDAAIEFAKDFYKRVFIGTPVCKAFQETKHHLHVMKNKQDKNYKVFIDNVKAFKLLTKNTDD